MGEASFLTDDEKRAAVGYEPLAREDEGSEGKGDGSDPSDSATEAEQRYNPSQPRVPAGNPDGGQWTGEGGGGSAAAHDTEGVEGGDSSDGEDEDTGGQGGGAENAEEPRRRPSVNLTEEEGGNHGGHTLRDHVGKSDEELRKELDKRYPQVLQTSRARRRLPNVFGGSAKVVPAGSFPSASSANDLVNRTLELHPEDVQAVADGRRPLGRIEHRFGFPTGKEAFRAHPNAKTAVRNTYSVRVFLKHDSRSENGFRVFTAFPMNKKSFWSF